MRIKASQMAFGGMMTAVSVVIMSLGSLIPVNTYICPVLCILITKPVEQTCGKRLAWCYYLATALLSLMLAPDREAAAVYCLLGYYPLIRPLFQRIRPGFLGITAKILFFTVAGAASWGMMMLLMGAEAVLAELRGTGVWMFGVTVLLWDVLFVMVDRLLDMNLMKKRK